MKLLQVEGARAPVPHSYRRHCLYRLTKWLIVSIGIGLSFVSKLFFGAFIDVALRR